MSFIGGKDYRFFFFYFNFRNYITSLCGHKHQCLQLPYKYSMISNLDLHHRYYWSKLNGSICRLQTTVKIKPMFNLNSNGPWASCSTLVELMSVHHMSNVPEALYLVTSTVHCLELLLKWLGKRQRQLQRLLYKGWYRGTVPSGSIHPPLVFPHFVVLKPE